MRRGRIGQAVFVLYLAANMATCAIVFAFWAMPRETISGLFGRWRLTERGAKRLIGAAGSLIADVLYFWEPDHCAEVYRIEKRAREILYPPPAAAVAPPPPELAELMQSQYVD
jgi:hypothetical protein